MAKKAAPKHLNKGRWTQDEIIAQQEKRGEPKPSRHRPGTHASHRSSRIWSEPEWRQR